MKRMMRYRPSPSMAVALAALVLAAGGVAFATIPNSNGTIQGCFHKSKGNLRAVESASDCKGNEKAIAWNQTGPKGDKGDPGSRTVLAEEPSEVSTSSTDWVDLGGPSVTVRDNSGLVTVVVNAALRAEGRFDPATNQGVCAAIGLFEPSDHNPPSRVAGLCQSIDNQFRSDPKVPGDLAFPFPFFSTPGTRTYSLRYRLECNNRACETGDRAIFSKRQLWVRPGG